MASKITHDLFSYIEPITVYSLSLVHIPKSTQKPNQSKPSQEGKENKEYFEFILELQIAQTELIGSEDF